jgi:hypothetical protein
MKSAMLDNPRVAEPPPQARHPLTPTDRPLTMDQFARAVGEHALRQAEIDQKMATRIVELRDELSEAKGEIRSLRAQVEQLIQGLSQGLAFAHLQATNATRSALQGSLASLRSR